jgi:hypothetical protein
MGGRAVENEVQSVSSATEEEDGSVNGDPVTEAITGKASRAVSTATGTNREATFRGDSEEQGLDSESPAPAVVKGGENEFVKVSHLSTIEVREVAQKHAPPRTIQRKITAPLNSTPSEVDDMDDTVDDVSRSKGRPRNVHAESQNVVDDPDDISESDSMDVIEKSPYEPGLNAEKGEKVFQDIKRLLKEQASSDDVHCVNPEAVKVFGPTNGWLLVKASGLIDKSGIVYSQEWVRGNFRGNVLGKIPNSFLLLCLVSSRFAKASELLLSGLCRDMEVYKIVNDALKAWGMEGNYKLVRLFVSVDVNIR